MGYIKIAEDDMLPSLLQEAMDHYLYVPRWQAQDLFDAILCGDEPTSLIRMAMLYEKQQPIAWVFVWKETHTYHGPSEIGDMWRFTKPRYRDQGISSRLSTALRSHLLVYDDTVSVGVNV